MQHRSTCDTYSAAPLYMRHVQCTDTDPCHMRHVYAGCMVVNSLMTFRMSKLLTLCLAAVSMARFCYATLHSLPQARFRFTFISRGSKLAVVPGPSLSRAPTFPQNATMYREAGARRGVVHFNLECPHSEFPQSSMD